MFNLRTITQIVDEIHKMGSTGDLAAVLVHFNDTYFIDERPPCIPGMARVAGMIDQLRNEVKKAVGDDRLIVLHSGDYLSPSSMSDIFSGSQMVDLLRHCNVRFATIGNHEFDFEKEKSGTLLKRLRNFSATTHLLFNLCWPTPFSFSEIAFWPAKDPFLAITGLVGRDTAAKAQKSGFSHWDEDWEEVASDLVAKVRRNPAIRGLILLTHMDRDEDRRLVSSLSKEWGNHGFVYVLGGHDHDISWAEADKQNAVLSKCLSNCKSINVVLLPKSGLGAPFPEQISRMRLSLTLEQEIAAANLGPEMVMRPVDESNSWREAYGELEGSPQVLKKGMVPRELLDFFASFRARSALLNKMQANEGGPPYSREEILEAVLYFSRNRSKGTLHDELYGSFEKLIKENFSRYGDAAFVEGICTGELIKDIVSGAAWSARENFRKSIYSIVAENCIEDLPINNSAAKAVKHWKSKAEPFFPHYEVVADFTSSASSGDRKLMDADDITLRSRSTDFGNFVADAIKYATEVDVALINSGSFRIDCKIPALISTNLLYETFTYGKYPGTVSTMLLSRDGLEAFLHHARDNGGRGAFLQVSDLNKLTTNGNKLIRVALITHMLADRTDQDGYQKCLKVVQEKSRSRKKCSTAPSPKQETMIELIMAGASCVEYSRKIRLRANNRLVRAERVARTFMKQIITLLRLQSEAGITETEFELLLRDNASQIRPSRLKEVQRALTQNLRETSHKLNKFVEKEIIVHYRTKAGRDKFIKELQSELTSSQTFFQLSISENKNISFSSWLDTFLYPFF